MILVIVDKHEYDNNNMNIKKGIKQVSEVLKGYHIPINHLHENDKTLSSLTEYEAVFLYSYRNIMEVLEDVKGITDISYAIVDKMSSKEYYKSVTEAMKYRIEEERQ